MFVIIYNDRSEKVEKNRDEFYQLTMVYAHGIVEEKLGFDIVSTDNRNLYQTIMESDYEDGKLTLQDQVMLESGEVIPVEIFAWKARYSSDVVLAKGLIVEIGDTKSRDYALKKQAEQSTII